MSEKNTAGNNLNKVDDSTKGYTPRTDQIYKSVSAFRIVVSFCREGEIQSSKCRFYSPLPNVVLYIACLAGPDSESDGEVEHDEDDNDDAETYNNVLNNM